jgi:hypothetical protein
MLKDEIGEKSLYLKTSQGKKKKKSNKNNEHWI